MTEEHRFLRELENAVGSVSAEARPTGYCPEPEEIWRASRGEVPSKRCRELLRHATSCAACLEAWSIAREVAKHAPAGALTARDRASRPWIVGGLAAAAAVIVLAISIPLVPRSRQAAEAPRFRAEETQAITSEVSEEIFLPRERCVLRWSAGPAGSTYDIEVADARMKVLASATGLKNHEFQVPTEALQGIEPEGTLLWRIEAQFPDGRQATSLTFLSHVR